jgi:flagellar biosynthesis/type III secretory pathway protein FliH
MQQSQSPSPSPRDIPLWIKGGRAPIPLAVIVPTKQAPKEPEVRNVRSAASLFLQRDFSDAALQTPVAPSFSADDMSAAEAAAQERGRLAGLAEAEESRQQYETMTLAAIAGAMAGARSAVREVADEAATAFARAVLAAMNVTMPVLIARSAVSEVSDMLACLMPGLAREPEIRMEVAPDLVSGVTASLDQLSHDDRVRITVAGIDGMAPGAAKIAWSTGQADRQPQQVWNRVVDAFTINLTDVASPETQHAE